MRCRFCNFQVPDEDWDVMLEHEKQKHPDKLKRERRRNDEEVFEWDEEDYENQD